MLDYSGLSIRRVVMRAGGDEDVRGGEATHRVATVHEGDERVDGRDWFGLGRRRRGTREGRRERADEEPPAVDVMILVPR